MTRWSAVSGALHLVLLWASLAAQEALPQVQQQQQQQQAPQQPQQPLAQEEATTPGVEAPSARLPANISQNLLPLPGGGAALVKPTKYHYYPHNQHMYLLAECAAQQVCAAVYIRLNWTQPLCACAREPCSASLDADDGHSTKLMAEAAGAVTLVKTCEPANEVRICRPARDWSLLALQNVRTGKSHYLVICRCPSTATLEGPLSHDQPAYASVPGIRVYGMLCAQGRQAKSLPPPLPRHKIARLTRSIKWD